VGTAPTPPLSVVTHKSILNTRFVTHATSVGEHAQAKIRRTRIPKSHGNPCFIQRFAIGQLQRRHRFGFNVTRAFFVDILSLITSKHIQNKVSFTSLITAQRRSKILMPSATETSALHSIPYFLIGILS
jgi:hypothetical protein